MFRIESAGLDARPAFHNRRQPSCWASIGARSVIGSGGGGHLPTSANLLRLAQTLSVSYEWLATGEGHMQGGSIDSEIPAVRLDCFAQSEQEEALLRSFRKLTATKRRAFVDLLEKDAF